MKGKWLLLVLFSLFFMHAGYAQITGPSAVTVGAPVTFSGPPGHRSYTWNNGVSGPLQIDLNTGIPRTQTTTLNGAQDVAVLYDHNLKKWYAFGFGWTSLALYRADLGTDPTQAAAVTMAAVPGTAFTGTDRVYGITFYYDNTTSKWHCFMAVTAAGSNPIRIRRFDFDDLAATPTETLITLPPQISAAQGQPYEIMVIKEDGEYMLFLSNYWGAPYRIDLGASITNSTPSLGAQLTAPGVASPTGMAFHKQDGVWYALMVGVNNTLMRYTFTNGIKDPVPSVSQVGTNLLSGNDKYRIRLVNGACGDQLLAFITGPASSLSRLDFNGDITSTPTGPVAVQTPNFPSQLNQGLYPYVYDNKLHMAVGIFGSNGIFNMKISDLPAGTQHIYNDPGVSLTFLTPGTYDVHLVVDMDGDVPTQAYCHTVTVTASSSGPAIPDPFTAAPSPVCQGANNVTYTVPAVSGATAYRWHYTGSNVNYTASTSQPTNTLSFLSNAAAGTLRVWAVDNNGDSSVTSRDTAITVNLLPATPSNFTASQGTVCRGQNNVTYTVPNVSGVTYNWSYTGGTGATINGTGNSVTVNFNASATSGTLNVTATNSCGTSTARSMAVTVNPLPDVTITPATTSICAGGSITLTGNGATTYSWSHSGGNIAAATFTPSATTTYTVTGTSSGCSATATRQMTVNALPVTQVTVTGGITEVCAGDSVRLTASGSGYTYTWKNSSGAVVGNGQQYAAYTTGSYKVIATDAGSGCADSTQSIDVRVYDRPVVSLDQADTSFCIGGMIRLKVATQDTDLTYVWKQDELTVPLATAQFLEIDEGGVYKVIVGRSAVALCEDSTNEVMVTVHDLPAVAVTWDNEVLHATPGYVSYQWYTGNQGIPGADDSTYIPPSNGGYSVTVVDSNGCTSTSEVEILKNVHIDMIAATWIRVYPNPVTGSPLYIDTDQKIGIVLSSIDGKTLLQGADIRSIDMDAYAGGIYLLRILDGNGMTIRTERIVKHTPDR